jgi:hypothetical protein
LSPLDALADVFFGGIPRTSTELQRLWSFRRGFKFGLGFSAVVVTIAAALVLL